MTPPRWTIRGMMFAVAFVAAIAFLWRQFPGGVAFIALNYGARTLCLLRYRSRWRAEGREPTEADLRAMGHASFVTTLGTCLVLVAGTFLWRTFR
jgi:hypothetical protein